MVRDVVRRANGTMAETTDDWYADDDLGNVWYLGEDTATYDEHGNLEDREGSWEAGVDGAEPGIIMPGHPRPADRDQDGALQGRCRGPGLGRAAKGGVNTPAGQFTDMVRTLGGPSGAAVISQKFYAAGLGIVEERDLTAGGETLGGVPPR